MGRHEPMQPLFASKEAGYIVAGANAEGDKIELIFETPKDALPADLAGQTGTESGILKRPTTEE